MSGEYSESRKFQGAYKISPEEISRICNYIRDFTGTGVVINLKLDNGGSLKGNDIAVMVEDYIVRSKRIRRLSLESRNYNEKNIKSVTFRADERSGDLDLDVTGTTENVTLLISRLAAEVQSWRLPYSFFSIKNKFSIRIAVYLFLFVLTFSSVFIRWKPNEIWHWFLIFFASYTVAGSISDSINYLFPPIEFEFPGSRRKYENIEKLRYGIFVLFILALAVGIAGSLIANWLQLKILSQG